MNDELKFICRDEILSYIGWIYNSDFNKEETLQHIIKYISSLTYLIVDKSQLEQSELWIQEHSERSDVYCLTDK